LAGKAGIGWLGQSGNLITPEYGKRQRLSAVLIEKPIFEFTDNNDHRWIEEFCKTCQACVKTCPTKAIYSEKKPCSPEIPGLGRLKTCIDYKRCFAYFGPTGGCSVCLKTCPFSKGPEAYDRIKKVFQRREV
jgi:epoxyqueuosine reductase QueG